MTVAPALRVVASDQVVSDSGDTGGGNQLRAKIVAAQTTGAGKITFSTGPATVLLSSTLPPITNNVTIDGGGLVAISGNNAYTILTVNSQKGVPIRANVQQKKRCRPGFFVLQFYRGFRTASCRHPFDSNLRFHLF